MKKSFRIHINSMVSLANLPTGCFSIGVLNEIAQREKGHHKTEIMYNSRFKSLNRKMEEKKILLLIGCF